MVAAPTSACAAVRLRVFTGNTATNERPTGSRSTPVPLRIPPLPP